MRFAVDFMNPKTGETRTITVELDEQEKRQSKDARADGRDPHNMWPLAYAMRRAYKRAPKGFQYIKASIRHVLH